jgi:hypothetical protein
MGIASNQTVQRLPNCKVGIMDPVIMNETYIEGKKA